MHSFNYYERLTKRSRGLLVATTGYINNESLTRITRGIPITHTRVSRLAHTHSIKYLTTFYSRLNFSCMLPIGKCTVENWVTIVMVRSIHSRIRNARIEL